MLERSHHPRTVASLVAQLGDGTVPMIGRRGVVRTGFDPLDRVLEGGFRMGDLALVGGAPGVGKTIATLQWARSMALSGDNAIFTCYEHDEASLLSRLLLMEAGELAHADGINLSGAIRSAVRSIASGERPFTEALDASPILSQAVERLSGYAPRLWLATGSARRTGIDELAGMVEQSGGDRTALFVDYLQKVAPNEPNLLDEERILRTAEGLKELALSESCAVVAVVAGDGPGLASRRLRLEHLRGSGALAYEADVVLMLNQKSLATSKVHIAYDSVKADAFKHWVVVSVEKNRDGVTGADLEFRKDFGFYRFDPLGGFVTERLVDDRMGNE